MADSIALTPDFSPRTQRWCIAVVLLVAAALRVPALDRVPPPLHPDEASRGYDAWCLWQTGADRYGVRWPAFLRSFGPGDYTAAITAYITAPFVGLLGPTPVAMRLPSALLGVLTVLGVWLWMRREAGAAAGITAALFLAVCPWHIGLTRTAHESGFVPFFLTWGFVGLSRAGLPPFHARVAEARNPARIAWAAFGGVMLSFGAWTYPASRLLIPLILVMIVLMQPRAWLAALQRSGSRGVAVGFWIAVAVAAAPIWITALRDPRMVAARAKATLLIHAPLSAGQMLLELLRNYGKEWNPHLLFWLGDDLCLERMPGAGRLLHFAAPFVIVGLLVVLRRAMSSFARAGEIRPGVSRFVLMLLLLYPLPMAICMSERPHPLRAVMGIVPWAAVSGIGAAWLFQRLRSPRGTGGTVKRPRLAVACAGVLLAANVVLYVYAYGGRFPNQVADFYQENITKALAYAGQHESEYDVIHVTEYVTQPYVYALLYAPILPREFAAADKVITPWFDNFEQVVRVNKYVFKPVRHPDAQRAYEREMSRFPSGSRGLAIDIPGRGPPGRVLLTLPRRNEDRDPGVEVREFVTP